MRRLLLTLPLILSGCTTLGPNFVPPEWQGPEAWRNRATPAAPISRPVQAPIDPNWWTLFRDPILTTLVQRVAYENLDVGIAALRIEQSRAQYDAAAAVGVPNINANSSYNRQKSSNVGQFAKAADPLGANGTNNSSAGGVGPRKLGAFDVFQIGFDASWEVDLWGRVRRLVEAADATSQASEEVRRGVLLTSIAEVARGYVTLRGVQSQLRIARDNVRTSEESLTLTRQRAAGGVTTSLDVSNASVQVSTTLAQIPSLEQQEAQLINAVSLLLGMPPGGLRATLETSGAVPPVPPMVPIGLPSELARRRPDVREAEAQLHAATASIGVAQAAFYPSVRLGASAGLQSIQFSRLFELNARQFAFGPGITVPLFEGGRLRASLRLTEAQQIEATLNYQRTVLRALHEVDNALIAYRAEQQRRSRLEDAVTENKRALEFARARYRQGVTDFLTVLDSQRTLLANELLLSASTTTVSANLVAVYKALGGGWETSFPSPAQTGSLKKGRQN